MKETTATNTGLRQSAVRSGAMAMSAAVSRPPTRKGSDPMNSCFWFRADRADGTYSVYAANSACRDVCFKVAKATALLNLNRTLIEPELL